jgi:dihydrofolate reductase
MVLVDISLSLDGFVAGPADGLGRGLGVGGEPIHDWVMGGSWTYDDGAPMRATGLDREVIDEMFAAAGAVIVGRRMYDVVDGWGEEETFRRPVFVVTSRPHPSRTVGETSYTFVTDGIRSALKQAADAAGDRAVLVAGGARLVQQFLAAGLVDEMRCTSHRSSRRRQAAVRASGCVAAAAGAAASPGVAVRHAHPLPTELDQHEEDDHVEHAKAFSGFSVDDVEKARASRRHPGPEGVGGQRPADPPPGR